MNQIENTNKNACNEIQKHIKIVNLQVIYFFKN
jgi:hypothetical protein